MKTIDTKMLFPMHIEHPEIDVGGTRRSMTVVVEGKSCSIYGILSTSDFSSSNPVLLPKKNHLL
jgi:hypothetical protein